MLWEKWIEGRVPPFLQFVEIISSAEAKKCLALDTTWGSLQWSTICGVLFCPWVSGFLSAPFDIQMIVSTSLFLKAFSFFFYFNFKNTLCMYMYIWLCWVLVAAHRILFLLYRVESLVTACELLAAACAIWLPECDGSQVPCIGSVESQPLEHQPGKSL